MVLRNSFVLSIFIFMFVARIQWSSTGPLLGAEVSAREILEVWNDTAIDNVSVAYQSTAVFSSSSSLDALSLRKPKKAGKKIVRRGMVFRYISDIGMYSEVTNGASLGRKMNFLGGRSLTIVKQEGDRPFSVTESFGEDTSEIMHDVVTERFLIWLHPSKSRLANDINSGLVEGFQLRLDEDLGNLAIGEIRNEQFVLAERYNWRPVTVSIDSEDGRRLTQTEFRYKLNETGKPVLSGWSSTSFSSDSGRVTVKSEVNVDQCVFGELSKEDLLLEIPADSLVTRIKAGQQHYAYVDKNHVDKPLTKAELALPVDASSATDAEIETAKDEVYEQIRISKPMLDRGTIAILVGIALVLGSLIWVNNRRNPA